METGHPSTRAVNLGSGNRALVGYSVICCHLLTAMSFPAVVVDCEEMLQDYLVLIAQLEHQQRLVSLLQTLLQTNNVVYRCRGRVSLSAKHCCCCRHIHNVIKLLRC